MGITARLDDYQQDHRWAGLALAVLYKLIDDQATALAAMLTYYGMVSLFPLLLLLVTCLGFALSGDPPLQQTVLHSALRDFPIIGDQLGQNVRSLHGSTFALIIGVLGSLYGGLGVSLATQNAMNKIWGIPRAERPDLPRAYTRGFALLAVFAADIVATTTLTSVATAIEAHGVGPVTVLVRLGATAASIALNIALVMLAYRILTSHAPSPRQLWAGALTASLLWQLLQGAGTYLVGHQLSRASATYGLFGIVLGLLTWIYLGALILILGAEINAVRIHHLYPRSLRAPDPNATPLTPADQRAYTSYAQTERQKTYQTIETAFELPPPEPNSDTPTTPHR
jgi:YihY family inner membrane protein